MNQLHGTTIVSVRRDGQVAVGGDGQVTLGDTVFKSKTQKVRKIYKDTVLVGFAGATADAFTLLDRFERKLEKYQGNLTRASVELTKDWRSDRVLRRLEAFLSVADSKVSLILSGNGDVIEPEEGLFGIGSGGNYARSAAIALLKNTQLTARDIVQRSLDIAADICVYTNHQVHIETLDFDVADSE